MSSNNSDENDKSDMMMDEEHQHEYILELEQVSPLIDLTKQPY